MEKNNKKTIILISIIILVIVASIIGCVIIIKSNKNNSTTSNNQVKEQVQEKIQEKSISDYINESIVAEENLKIKEDYGNEFVLPKGFKISKESGKNLTEGIVIEDKIGNQYVWIPVGDNLKNGNTSINIKLERLIFNDDGTVKSSTTNATEKIKEKETNMLSFYELTKTETATNSQAIDIEEFINSANNNGGYYIARYEASKNYSTGKANSKGNSVVWGNITQPSASTASKNIYDNNYGVTSDLVNSFAWDTAITYIQSFSKTSNGTTYSKEGKFSGKGTSSKTKDLVKTGANKDEQCKINDMSGNVSEWSTETSTMKLAEENCDCVPRGGTYYRGYKMSTAWRDYQRAVDSYPYIGFRTILYIK